MVEVDTRRTQPVVDRLLNSSLRGESWRKRDIEPIDLRRPPGRRGGNEGQNYDFGDSIAVPAVVVDGRVKRLDGKPYRP